MSRWKKFGLNISKSSCIFNNRIGEDVILFANPDSDTSYREHGMVRLSTDGGRTWRYSKQVTDFGEWFDYSAMTIATDGTILLMYKTTPSMAGLPSSSDECCSMCLARFNLKWITNTSMRLSSNPNALR